MRIQVVKPIRRIVGFTISILSCYLSCCCFAINNASSGGNRKTLSNDISITNGGASSSRTAIVTLANKDEYALGAIVLAKSLIATESVYGDSDFVILVPPDTLKPETTKWLQEYYKIIHPPSPVIDLANSQRKDLNLLASPKLFAWNLIQYDRILYVDSDAFVRKKANYFDNEKYWKGTISGVTVIDLDRDNFAGGLLAIRPNTTVYEKMMHSLFHDKVDYANAEQGFLNKFFASEWINKPQIERLPRDNQLCAAYCVVAEVKPKYLEMYLEQVHNAAFFDSQGQAKPWSWPTSMAYKLCEMLNPIVRLWTLVAYSTSISHVRYALLDYWKSNGSIRNEVASEVIGHVWKMLLLGKVNKEYYSLVSRSTQPLFHLSLDFSEYGTLKPKNQKKEMEARIDPVEVVNKMKSLRVEIPPSLSSSVVKEQLLLHKQLAVSTLYVRNQEKILCVVRTHKENHKSRIEPLKQTWLSHCDGVVIASNIDDPSIPTIKISHAKTESRSNLWKKSRRVLQYIRHWYLEEFDWFYIADDDAFVIIENLRFYLQQLEHKEDLPLYFGKRLKLPAHDEIVFNSLGPGFVVNRKALQLLVESFNTCTCSIDDDAADDNDDKDKAVLESSADDLMIGRCFLNKRIVPYDTRETVPATSDDDDKKKRVMMKLERFHAFSPLMMMNMPKKVPLNPAADTFHKGWDLHYNWYSQYAYPKMTTSPSAVPCCSKYSIAFHLYLKGDDRNTMIELYQQVYGSRASENGAIINDKEEL